MEPQTQIKTLELQIAELEKALADMTLEMQKAKIDALLSQSHLNMVFKYLKSQNPQKASNILKI